MKESAIDKMEQQMVKWHLKAFSCLVREDLSLGRSFYLLVQRSHTEQRQQHLI